MTRQVIVLFLTAQLAAALTLQDAPQVTYHEPGFRVAKTKVQLPAVGFGTCCRASSRGQALIDSLKFYLSLGGRHIDTSESYMNLKEIAVAIKESGVPREELWVTSKVMMCKTIKCGDYRTKEDIIAAVNSTVKELGLDYVDLMLLENQYPIEALRVKQWEGLIDARMMKVTKTIGVSNFQLFSIWHLKEQTEVLPQVVEINFHPQSYKRTFYKVRELQDNGVAVIAYNVLRWPLKLGENVTQLAKARNTTPAAMLLRWALDQGVAVVAGMTSQEHIQEDLIGTMNSPIGTWHAPELHNFSNMELPDGLHDFRARR